MAGEMDAGPIPSTIVTTVSSCSDEAGETLVQVVLSALLPYVVAEVAVWPAVVRKAICDPMVYLLKN